MFFSKSTLFSIATASLFAFKDVSAKTVDIEVSGTVEHVGNRRKLLAAGDEVIVSWHLTELEESCEIANLRIKLPLDFETTAETTFTLTTGTSPIVGPLDLGTIDSGITFFPVTGGIDTSFIWLDEPGSFSGALTETPVPFDSLPAAYPAFTRFETDSKVLKSNIFDPVVMANPNRTWKLVITAPGSAPGTIQFNDPVEVPKIFLTALCNDGSTEGGAIGFVGDPHFTTFADKHYDFQGECDLVTVQNNGYKNGKGMHVHARTTNYGSWSSTTSAAIKIGDDVIEVHGEDMALINGVEYPVPEIEGSEFNFPMTIGDYSLTVQILGPHSRRHIIHMGDGEKIMINNFKEFVDVEFEGVKAEDYDGAVGMLGAYSQGGAMMGRDGKTVFEDADAFGQEWQVNPTDPHLFHIIDGPQYPARCKMPEAPTAEQRHLRAMAKKVSEDDAKKACANASRKENCIADVFGSDNLEMANIYTMGSL